MPNVENVIQITFYVRNSPFFMENQDRVEPEMKGAMALCVSVRAKQRGEMTLIDMRIGALQPVSVRIPGVRSVWSGVKNRKRRRAFSG